MFNKVSRRGGILWIISLVAMLAIFWQIGQLIKATEVEKVAVFTADTYLPYEPEYCPGDILFFDSSSYDLPRGMHTVVSQWKLTRPRAEGGINTRIFEEQETLIVNNPYHSADEPIVFPVDRRVPDVYYNYLGEDVLLQVAVQWQGDGWSSYQIPFRIREDCMPPPSVPPQRGKASLFNYSNFSDGG